MRLEVSHEEEFYNYVMDNYPEDIVMIIKIQKMKSWPDRLLFLRNSRVLLIEFKRQDGALSKGQLVIINKLKKLGHIVKVVYSCEKAKQCLNIALRKCPYGV